jgi:hypothetical protein
LLLLSIADNAHENGFAFPGIDYLAKKTRLSPRTVMRLIQEIEATNELIVNRDKKFNRYVVNIYDPEFSDYSQCDHCGIPDFPELHNSIQKHHKIPRSEGGTDSIDNIAFLCALCHGDQHGERERRIITTKISSANLSLINQIREKHVLISQVKGDKSKKTSDKNVLTDDKAMAVKSLTKKTSNLKSIDSLKTTIPEPSVKPSFLNHKELTLEEQIQKKKKLNEDMVGKWERMCISQGW